MAKIDPLIEVYGYQRNGAFRANVNVSFNTDDLGFGINLTLKQARTLRNRIDEAIQEAKK